MCTAWRIYTIRKLISTRCRRESSGKHSERVLSSNVALQSGTRSTALSLSLLLLLFFPPSFPYFLSFSFSPRFSSRFPPLARCPLPLPLSFSLSSVVDSLPLARVSPAVRPDADTTTTTTTATTTTTTTAMTKIRRSRWLEEQAREPSVALLLSLHAFLSPHN